MSAEDIETIETVKKEEKLRSDSAALRRVIEDGRKYRQIMSLAHANAMKNFFGS